MAFTRAAATGFNPLVKPLPPFVPAAESPVEVLSCYTSPPPKRQRDNQGDKNRVLGDKNRVLGDNTRKPRKNRPKNRVGRLGRYVPAAEKAGGQPGGQERPFGGQKCRFGGQRPNRAHKKAKNHEFAVLPYSVLSGYG
jgi:hypothetical protein